MKCNICGSTLKQYVLLGVSSGQQTELCPKCQAACVEEVRAVNKAMISKHLESQHVPIRYHEARLQKEHLAFPSGREVQNGEKGLYIFGDSGVGKTWLLVAWMKYYLSKGAACTYVDWSDFMVDLRMDIKAYQSKKAYILRSDCVFIDDFDSSNSYMYDVIYNLINSLYSCGKVLFLTSIDLPTQPEIAMRLGEITSQLHVIRQ